MLPTSEPLPPGWALAPVTHLSGDESYDAYHVHTLGADLIVSVLVCEGRPGHIGTFAFDAVLNLPMSQIAGHLDPSEHQTTPPIQIGGYDNRREACIAADQWVERQSEKFQEVAERLREQKRRAFPNPG